MVDLEQIVSEPGLDMDRLWQRGIAPSSASQKEIFSSLRYMPTKAELSWEIFCQKEV